MQKSVEKSDKRRLVGNEFYGKKDLYKALAEYSIAIQQAPTNSKQLPLAYGNRSAVLLELRNYEACILDLDRARDCAVYSELPQQLQNKLLKRRETAENHQKNSKSKEVSEEKYQEIYKNSQHSKFTAFCNSIEVKFDENKGRKIVATEKIPSGSLILREWAHAAVLFDALTKYLCQFCCKPLPLGWIPCENCSDERIRYCDEQCRKEATIFHQYECAFPILEPVPAKHFDNDPQAESRWLSFQSKIRETIRVMVKAKPKEIASCDPESRAKSGNFLKVGEFGCAEEENFGPNLTSIVTFYGHEWDPVWDKAIPMIVEQFQKHNYFSDNSHWPKKSTVPERQAKFGRVFKSLLSKLCCNSYSIDPFVINTGDPIQSNLVSTLLDEGYAGSGIYPFASLINHSCLPNLFQVSDGRKLELRASRDIEPGEELFGNYGPKFGLHMRETRQEVLKKRFNFQCLCVACTDFSYRQLELERHHVNCEQCHMTVASYANKPKCQNCGTVQKQSSAQLTQQLKGFHARMKAENALVDPLKQRLMFDLFMRKLETMLYEHNETLVSIRGDYANLLMNLNAIEEALEQYKKVSAYYEHYFTRHSFEFCQILTKIVVTAHQHGYKTAIQDNKSNNTWIQELENEALKLLTTLCGQTAARQLVGMYHGQSGLKWFDSVERKR